MLNYAVVAGDGHAAGVFRRQVTALETGRPVVVAHGYMVGLPTEPGPFVVEADGSVAPLTEVYADPDARPRTVSHYVRADGSVA